MILEIFEAKNFKSLEHVRVNFEPGINLIVGPNGIGKTTVLDAIRFVKALFAPRTQNETFQTLLSLGASSHVNRAEIFLPALAGNPYQVVEVHCIYKLSAVELTILRESSGELAQDFLKRQTNFTGNLSGWITFISNFQGMAMLKQAVDQVSDAVRKVEADQGRLKIGITCNPTTKATTPDDGIAPVLLAFLETRLPPKLTRFSYFPADRALPRGEQPIQFGSQDAIQTLESHSSQAELKYSRIKNHIFNALIESESARKTISDDFESMFLAVLRGKTLAPDAFGVNVQGQLSIKVIDIATNRPFDIDQMSSGEKSLILTFLMIKRSLEDGGVVLLDEPELHLNPAVCGDVLHFLADQYVAQKNLQVISCTHSPEIVAAAFGRDDCHIYHLESGTVLVKARREDDEEISEALHKLGTSEAESLLYPSTLFVEGVSDVEILETGFGELLRRHNIKDVGGRNEVEKAIRVFQDREKHGKSFPVKYFLFDRDRLPTSLSSSGLVKLHQLERRCIENYLIDVDIITTCLREEGACSKPPLSAGRLEIGLRNLALHQLRSHAIKDAFQKQAYGSIGVRDSDIEGKAVREAADSISERIEGAKETLKDFDASAWKDAFISRVAEVEGSLRGEWEKDWAKLCDGKQLFLDLRSEFRLRIKLEVLKSRLVREMKSRRTDLWEELNSTLKRLVVP